MKFYQIFSTSLLNSVRSPLNSKWQKLSVPIFKSDDETDPNNYRPISLLSCCNRIFEKLVFKRLKSFIDERKIICSSQYGFRQGHSTEHAILDIGLLSKIRHFVPFHTLVSIYNTLVVPYLRYGLIAWGQTGKTQLNKLLILQKRALRFMCFADRCEHAIPALFLRAQTLPIHFLYYKLLAETMHDVSNDVIPSQLKDLFIPTVKIHS